MEKNIQNGKQIENINICPYCHLVVASGNPEKTQTVHGWAHYPCVLAKTAKEMSQVGLSKPNGYCHPWQLKNFFIDQAENLLKIPMDSSTEKKLAAIITVAEEVGCNLKISSLTTKE